jgi:hypothetical protein
MGVAKSLGGVSGSTELPRPSVEVPVPCRQVAIESVIPSEVSVSWAAESVSEYSPEASQSVDTENDDGIRGADSSSG